MKSFHILKVCGCAEDNQKKVTGKMFDKLEKFIGVWSLLQLLSLTELGV
jgi:hypothetical protein